MKKTSVQLARLARKETEYGPFGLGCLTNIFCSLLPKRHLIEVVESTNELPERGKIHDMLRFRPRVVLVNETDAPDVTPKYRRAYFDPAQPTRLFFSDEETEFMNGLLRTVGFDADTQNYLVICPNDPGNTIGKKLSVEEWMDFIDCYHQDEKTIVIMPTFSPTSMDKTLGELIKQNLGIRVLNLQDLLVRNRQILGDIVASQPRFGEDRNAAGLSYRQDAALYNLLIRRDNQGLFQDSAPVHIASAASQQRVISDKVYSPVYAPRNDGSIRRLLKDTYN